MKKLVVYIVQLFFVVQLNAQVKGCSDSIVFSKFSPTLFQYFNNGLNTVAQRDSADNIFVGGSYGAFTGFTGIIKFDNRNQSSWAKWYKPSNNNSAIKNFGQLVVTDDSANLFFTGGTVSSPPAYKMLVTKLDSSGSFSWAKELYTPGNINYSLNSEVPVSNGGNLYFYTPDGDIVALSNAGNILWAKKRWDGHCPPHRFSVLKEEVEK